MVRILLAVTLAGPPGGQPTPRAGLGTACAMLQPALTAALSARAQANLEAFLDAVKDWSDDDKIKVIIAVGEAGY